MKIVYVAHPLRGDIEGNMAHSAEICREISERYPDVLPLSPLAAFSFLDDTVSEERERALDYCRQLLARADELWLTGTWWLSEGCVAEVFWATAWGIPIAEYGGGGYRWLLPPPGRR